MVINQIKIKSAAEPKKTKKARPKKTKVEKIETEVDKPKKTKRTRTVKTENKTSNKISTATVKETATEAYVPATIATSTAKPSKNKIFLIVKWAIAAIVFIFVLITVNLYFGDLESVFNRKLTELIPYPGLIINHKVILLRDFQNDVVAVEKNLKRQDIPYTIKDVKASALKTLIQREVILDLAKQQNLTVTDEEINQQMDPFITAQGGTEKTNALINDLYGWDISILKEKIMKVLLLSQKLADNLKNVNGDVQKAEQLKQVKETLNTAPEKFNELASQLNEDNSKFTNGDLGWFKLGDNTPEFEAAILNLKPGEISDVVESADGYHLIKLDEEKTDNQQITFHASHIFLKKASFQDYLDQQTKKANVISLIKIK